MFQKEISDRQVLQYRMEVKSFLVAFVYKLLDKAPIRHSLIRNLKCLNPNIMTTKANESKTMFRNVLSSLNHTKRVDEIVSKFDGFVEIQVSNVYSQFKNFDKCKDRIDTLLYCFISQT